MQSFVVYHFQDTESFRLYHFEDIKVARVAKVGKFRTLSFSLYHICEGCKVSYFIILRMSRLLGLQRLESFVLYHFQDIIFASVAKFRALSF